MAEEAGHGADSAEPVAGLTSARALSLERFPIRTRESGATLSSWRLYVICGEGEGSIVRVDASSGEEFHRGEGVFLGWSEERLAAAYDALRPRSEEPGYETPQLG